MRYWSLCLSSILTTTSACFSDGGIRNKASEFITLAVGTDDIREAAYSKGFEFLSKGINIFPIFLYRNLLSNPAFAGHLPKVPNLPTEAFTKTEEYAAKKYIGDYAPEGVICSKAEFVATGCAR